MTTPAAATPATPASTDAPATTCGARRFTLGDACLVRYEGTWLPARIDGVKMWGYTAKLLEGPDRGKTRFFPSRDVDTLASAPGR